MSDSVSRETPPTPVAASGVFGSRLEVAEEYVRLLASDGTERGLLGPREIPRLWDRHLLNCAALSGLIPPDASVVDLGSGAGLPGVVLAICRPDVEMTLVEPLLRRSTFLDEVVAGLELTNVTVRRCRAEELAGHARFDVVTSRALAPLDRLLRWSLPLVAPGGVVLAIKGAQAEDEVAALALSAEARELVSVRRITPGALPAFRDGENLVPTTVVRVESALARDVPWARSRDEARKRRPGSSQPRHR
jgi:16S rRNA (guanine527-N7)-methyltransferase